MASVFGPSGCVVLTLDGIVELVEVSLLLLVSGEVMIVKRGQGIWMGIWAFVWNWDDDQERKRKK